jgi:hypothetical protein
MGTGNDPGADGAVTSAAEPPSNAEEAEPTECDADSGALGREAAPTPDTLSSEFEVATPRTSLESDAPTSALVSDESLVGCTPALVAGIVTPPVLDAHVLVTTAAWPPTPPRSPPTIRLVSLTPSPTAAPVVRRRPPVLPPHGASGRATPTPRAPSLPAVAVASHPPPLFVGSPAPLVADSEQHGATEPEPPCPASAPPAPSGRLLPTPPGLDTEPPPASAAKFAPTTRDTAPLATAPLLPLNSGFGAFLLRPPLASAAPTSALAGEESQ